MRYLFAAIIYMIVSVAGGQEDSSTSGVLVNGVFYDCPPEYIQSPDLFLEHCVGLPSNTGIIFGGVHYDCPVEHMDTPVEAIVNCVLMEEPSLSPSFPQPITHPQSLNEEDAQITQIRYTVQTGDNLSFIARRFGVTVEILVAVNHIDNPDLIHRGNLLIIPQG